MRDLLKLGLALAAVVALMVVGFSAVAHRADDVGRRIRSEALQVRVERTNEDLDRYSRLMGQYRTRVTALQVAVTLLEEQADVKEKTTLEALAARQDARSEVEEDTLAPALQRLLGAERAVAEGYHGQLVVALLARVVGDSIVRIESARADEAVSLLWGVRAERDSALTLLADYRRGVEFSISRLLFRDLPRKAACAAGGAVVASINKGDVMLGAGVALVACLLVENIL